MHKDYEAPWIEEFHKGNYYKALELTMLFGTASTAKINALSALVIAQAIGQVVEALKEKGV